jgi:hypothetical protein
MQRLEVSGAVRHIYMTLGGKGLDILFGTFIETCRQNSCLINAAGTVGHVS